MFAPIVLPFQITLVILVVVLVSIGVFLRRKSAKSDRADIFVYSLHPILRRSRVCR